MKPKTNRARRPENRLTPAQLSTIMIICSQYGISKEVRAQMYHDRYGKTSTADLNTDQAGHFIAEFEKKGFVIKGGNSKNSKTPRTHRTRSIPRTGNVIALVSQDERDKIDQLAKVVPWREVNGLALFLEKRMGIKDGKVITGQHAYLAIEGLKKMISNGMKKVYGPQWWLKTYSDPALNEFIRIHKPGEWR